MVDNDDALLSIYFPKSLFQKVQTVCLLVAGGDNYQQRLGTLQEQKPPPIHSPIAICFHYDVTLLLFSHLLLPPFQTILNPYAVLISHGLKFTIIHNL